MLEACSMLGFECSVCPMLGYLMLGDARARKCSHIGARTRSMLGKSMLDPTLKFKLAIFPVFISRKRNFDLGTRFLDKF